MAEQDEPLLLLLGEEFFESSDDEAGDEEGASAGASESLIPAYSVRVCDLEWFMLPAADSLTCTDFNVLKYQADLSYSLQTPSPLCCQTFTATPVPLYQAVLSFLPPSNAVVSREVCDSLARCYLARGEPDLALERACQLVLPPHDKDSCSWLLQAQCHQALGQHRDQLLALQRCVSLQRYHGNYWILLYEAYLQLSSTRQTQADHITNSERRKLEAILQNTFNLLRPYFSWRNETALSSSSSSPVAAPGSPPHRSPFTDLLTGRCTAEGLASRGSGEGEEGLGELWEMAACASLLWARQLLFYSVRCSKSFAAAAQRRQLSRVERLLVDCPHHGDLSRHLTRSSVADQLKEH